MVTGPKLYEDERSAQERDPQEDFIRQRRLFTQPYDIVISSLMGQIEDKTMHLRLISESPNFQRRYVWPVSLASLLIESILLDVPIPPCYLSQDRDYTLEVIDGQQRIFSVYRFLNNQFKLRNLESLKEYNDYFFYELPPFLRRKIETYTLRCVIVTNNSDPEIKFEVFERLNTSTVPLNAQELRNSISRGALIDLLVELAQYPAWLKILNRKVPDKRMRDEELILRFFAFHTLGLNKYRTPQKRWLNDAADAGRNFESWRIDELSLTWKQTLENCLLVFRPEECFRRTPLAKRQVVNRALMDLTMFSLTGIPSDDVERASPAFRSRYEALLKDREFDDLITRSIDHRSRTVRRFQLWDENVTSGLF